MDNDLKTRVLYFISFHEKANVRGIRYGGGRKTCRMAPVRGNKRTHGRTERPEKGVMGVSDIRTRISSGPYSFAYTIEYFSI